MFFLLFLILLHTLHRVYNSIMTKSAICLLLLQNARPRKKREDQHSSATTLLPVMSYFFCNIIQHQHFKVKNPKTSLASQSQQWELFA